MMARCPGRQSAHEPLRVLLAEDDPVLAQVLLELLAEEGHSTTHVQNMHEAQHLVAAEPWDVLLTDGSDSPASELSDEERARLRALGAYTAVVVQTGRAWAKNIAPADLGVAAILNKPYDLDLLLQTLSTIPLRRLRRRRAGR